MKHKTQYSCIETIDKKRFERSRSCYTFQEVIFRYKRIVKCHIFNNRDQWVKIVFQNKIKLFFINLANRFTCYMNESHAMLRELVSEKKNTRAI